MLRKEKREQDLHSKKIYTVTIFRTLKKADDENVLLATDIERIKIIISWGTESVVICPIFIGITNKTRFPRIRPEGIPEITLITRKDLDIPLEAKQEAKEDIINKEIVSVETFVSGKPDIKLVVFIVNVNEFDSDMIRLRTFMYRMLLPSSYLTPHAIYTPTRSPEEKTLLSSVPFDLFNKIYEKIYSGEQTSASAATPSTPVNASAPTVAPLSRPLTIMAGLLANLKLTPEQRASITQQRNLIAAEEMAAKTKEVKSLHLPGQNYAEMTDATFEQIKRNANAKAKLITTTRLNAVRTGIVQGNNMTTAKFENAVKPANTRKRSNRKRQNRRKTRRREKMI